MAKLLEAPKLAEACISTEKIVAMIFERAEKEHPDDFVMREYVVKQQIEAFERLEKMKNLVFSP